MHAVIFEVETKKQKQHNRKNECECFCFDMNQKKKYFLWCMFTLNSKFLIYIFISLQPHNEQMANK